MAKATEKLEQEKAKKTALDIELEKIEKDYGKGTVMGATEKPMKVDTISTGSLGVDIATGINGLPKGRIVEVYGPESSGKTTLCIQAIAEAHKADPNCTCAFIDMEHALDLSYVEALGVDLKRLKISQPDYGEQALEIAKRLIKTGEIAVVVVDSVAALVPKDELEGEIGKAGMGKQARMMSQTLRMLVGTTEKTGTLLLFTNQLRDKIGVMFGSPETTTGGNALKFYASMRLDIRRIETIKEGETAISNRVRVKVVKNKLAPPFTKADFNIEFGIGTDRTREVVDIATEMNIIKKNGAFYSYEESRLGQGIKNVVALLNDNPELLQELDDLVVAQIKEGKIKAPKLVGEELEETLTEIKNEEKV